MAAAVIEDHKPPAEVHTLEYKASVVDADAPVSKQSRCAAVMDWLKSPACYICINFCLSQWGDWMWQFAVGVYFVRLSTDDRKLLLAAIYGFTGGGLVLLFGGVIGDWVDRNKRLKVVRISLFLQNLSVALSCVVVCIRMYLSLTGVMMHLLDALVIVTAISAQLASVAYKIAIEKDWVVVIAGNSSKRLANLNATLRTIDLICKVLSPTLAGFIMTYVSKEVSAIVLAAWNILSMFLEYFILTRIYRMLPALAVKTSGEDNSDNGKATVESCSQPPEIVGKGVYEPVQLQETAAVAAVETSLLNTSEQGGLQDSKITQVSRDIEHNGNSDVINAGKFASETDRLKCDDDSPPNLVETEPHSSAANAADSDRPCWRVVCEPFITLGRGWAVYARQPAVCASVSLAMLYMTVLGFDSITIGYIDANGIGEYMVGIVMAMAGVTGVIGTLLFTRLQRRIGLERTGLFAFNIEIGFLILAVASIWAPGSKFDPNYASSRNRTVEDTAAAAAANLSMADGENNGTTTANMANSTAVVYTWDCQSSGGCTSIILLLVGIVLSRIGLWMADLVVTQLMQESIVESERGIVNGVQNSLNMLMDMLKFALVIIIPQIELFGIHIILSFTFIVAGGVLFAVHSRRVRGHLFHFSRIKDCCMYCCNRNSNGQNGGSRRQNAVA